MKMIVRIIATGLVLALFGLGFQSVSATPSRKLPMSTKMTTLTVKLKGCEGCHLEAWSNDGSSTGWHKRSKISGGKAVFKMPTIRTHGMAFTIDTPDRRSAAGGNAASMVVMRYTSVPVGKNIWPLDAVNKTRGHSCWVGTNRTAATIKFELFKFEYTFGATGPDNGKGISVWASPQLQTVDDWDYEVHLGGLGTQDPGGCPA